MTEKYDYDSGNSVRLILKAQAGDSESLKKMVEINTPLVKAMVRRYNSFNTGSPPQGGGHWLSFLGIYFSK